MALTSQFLKDLLSKIPEADRAVVEAALEKPEAADAVKFADDGAARHADYSRAMDAMRKTGEELEIARAAIQRTHEEQTQWWTENRGALAAARRRLTGDPDDPPADPDDPPSRPSALPPDVMRRADVEKLMAEYVGKRDLDGLSVITQVNDLAFQHFQTFGERLNTTELVQRALTDKTPIASAYQTIHGERHATKAKEADEARIKEAEERGREAGRREATSHAPYPIAGDPGSPLDVLAASEKRPDPSQFSAEAAADEYAQLAAKRIGG